MNFAAPELDTRNSLAQSAKEENKSGETRESMGGMQFGTGKSMQFGSMDENESGEIWDRVICLHEKMKKVPNLKIGVLGNCDVGKTSLS